MKNRICVSAWLLAAFAAVALHVKLAAQNDFVYPRWIMVKPGSFTFSGNDVRVSGNRGWARTSVLFGDFSLKLEVRVMTTNAAARLIVRASMSPAAEWPDAGYRILLGARSDDEPLGSVRAIGQSEMSFPKDPEPFRFVLPAGEWQAIEVRGEGDRLIILVAGTPVNSIQVDESPGYLGIETVRGDVEFRNIRVARLPADMYCPTFDEAAVREQQKGLVLPTLLTDRRPMYTADAMRRKVQGGVKIQLTVGTVGTVERACIMQSLDPEMDREALAAAKAWRFRPATRDGVAVRAPIYIDMTFTLR